MTNDQFFTRADWRPGKKHKLQLRTKPWGGRKVAPAAFLEAGKANAILPGRTNRRICSAVKRDGAPCGMLALKKLTVCGAHGGFSVWAKQGKLKRSGKKAALKAERAATVEGQVENASAALAHMPIYQQADQRTRMKLVRAYNSALWPTLLREIQQRVIDRCV